jgi:hypothetical protein
MARRYAKKREWRLWISKRVGLEGEAFSIWNYDADIGDVYSMRIAAYADEPGTAPPEEDPCWFWEIYWGTSGGPRNEMLEGKATSRSAAKRDCVNALLLRMLSIFKDTGDLLRGELSDQLKDNEDLGELDWGTSIEPSLNDSAHDSWCYAIRHDEFYLSLDLPLEMPIDKVTQPIALELGAWRWWIIDEVDTICEGTAPSRTLARERCVGALLDHLTEICLIAEELRDLNFPSNECTDRERPSRYKHEPERLDPNWTPEKPDHPVAVEILRAVEAGASADRVLAAMRMRALVNDRPISAYSRPRRMMSASRLLSIACVHKVCAELPTDDMRAAIGVHRAKCPLSNCAVLAALEAFVAARESHSQNKVLAESEAHSEHSREVSELTPEGSKESPP